MSLKFCIEVDLGILDFDLFLILDLSFLGLIIEWVT